MTELSNVSIAELLAEVNQRQQALPKLIKQKAMIQKKLAVVEEQIRALGVDAVNTGKAGKQFEAVTKFAKAPNARLPRNKISLRDALLMVLHTEKAMSIPEIISAVKAKGYRSNSRNFAMIVSQTLSKAGKKVVRVKRGEYALAGWVMSRSLM